MRHHNRFPVVNKKIKVLTFPFLGLLAIIWFLVRVIPKPSRITYPCQQLATSLGGGFFAYLAGALFGGSLIYQIKKQIIRRRAELFLVICFVAAFTLIFLHAKSIPGSNALITEDPPNQPIGVAGGIFPGRVVWYYDMASTNWDGSTGFWWEDTNTDQKIVNEMLAGAVRSVGGQTNLIDAWQQIFKFYNKNNGNGDHGYIPGEKIVIKINGNQDAKQTWDNGGFQSPHLIYSLVSQLIENVGVSGSDITIAEPSRYIGDPIYNKIRSNPNQNYQDVRFIVKPGLSGSGRIGATPDLSQPIHFVEPYPNDPNIRVHYPPVCYTEAAYLINLGLLRSHTLFGVTLSAKNHFGSVYNGSAWSPSLLHGSGITYNPPNEMGNPHCHPVLIGHEHLGGKTILYILDGLYTAVHQGSKSIVKWQTLSDDWCSSLLVSQDPVALDSVALDFLRNETNMQTLALNQHVCNYLHEAALAFNPPSGAIYDPEDDGSPLQSLGTHEHWNNPFDRKYSRDLGLGDGIELKKINPYHYSPLKIDLNDDGQEDILWRNYVSGANALWYLSSTGTAAGLSQENIRIMARGQGQKPVQIYRGVMEAGEILYRDERVYHDVMEIDVPHEKVLEIVFRDPREVGEVFPLTEKERIVGDAQALMKPENQRAGVQAVSIIGTTYLNTVTDINWNIVGAGDFNGDGHVDILWRHYMNGANALWYMNGNTIIGTTYLTAITDLNWKIEGTGDFNGDGNVDILWRHYVSGQNALWYMSGHTILGTAYMGAGVDTNWDIEGTGDFNGDGHVDILWSNYVTGQNGVWYMDASKHKGTIYLLTNGDVNWRVGGVGDFNGDGNVDILWRHSVNGQNALWYMNGSTYIGYEFVVSIVDVNWKIENH